MGSKARIFVCPRSFQRYVILTGQSNMSINFCVRLIVCYFQEKQSTKLVQIYVFKENITHVIPLNENINKLQHDRTNKMTVRPAMTQISLGIRPV